MSSLKTWLLVSALAIVVLGIHYSPAIFDDKVLLAGDYNYATSAQSMPKLRATPSYGVIWEPVYLLGMNLGLKAPNLYNLIQEYFPDRLGFFLNDSLPFLLLALTAFLLFRGMRLGMGASVVTSILLAFSPLHFTLVNPGHLAKYCTILFFPLALYFLNRALLLRQSRFLHYVLAGFALGLAFLQGESPVAFYFSIALFFYFWFMLPAEHAREIFSASFYKKYWKDWLKFAALALCAVSLAWPVLIQQAGVAFSAPKGEAVPTLEKQKSPEESGGWNWATQWSFPPEETVDLFAPGVFGTQTGDPAAPYWGRTGRTEGWTPENQVGFQNFSSLSNYPGIYLFLFALIALVFVRSRAVYFWGAVAVIALLLSYGKHLPFYWLFYHLPMMDKFRNPNRFLHLVHIALGILAAYGLDFLLRSARESALSGLKRFVRMLYFSFVGLAVVALVVFFFAHASLTESFTVTFGEASAETIVGNMSNAMWKFLFVITLAMIPLWLLIYRNSVTPAFAVVISAVILVIGVLDLTWVNMKYLRFYNPAGTFQKDELVEAQIGKNATQRGRYKLATRGAYLKNFLDNVSPYYGIETLDVPASRGYPDDLETFMRMVNPGTLRHYQLLNVDTFFSEVPYNLFGLLPNTRFANPYDPNQPIFGYHYPGAVERATLVHEAIVETNRDAIFAVLNSSLFDPRKTVLLTRENSSAAGLAASPSNKGLGSNEVSLLSYKSREVRVKTASAQKGVLVLADYYSPEWGVWIDGVEKEIFRANYLLRGVTVEAGSHEVVFKIKNRMTNLLLPWVFWLIAAVALAIFIAGEWRSRKENLA